MKDPKITFYYMETDQDKNEMRERIRLTREILAQTAFQSFAGKEFSLGEGVQKMRKLTNLFGKMVKALTTQLASVEWEMTRNRWLIQKVGFTGWRTSVLWMR